MRPISMICLTFGLMIGLSAERAKACSCAAFPEADELLSDATVLFLGEVTGSLRVDLGTTFVNFEVLEGYKGLTGTEIGLVTGGGDGDCGIPASPGAILLVAGYASDSGLSFGSCTTFGESDGRWSGLQSLTPLELAAGPDAQWPPYDLEDINVDFCGLGVPSAALISLCVLGILRFRRS